MNSPARTVRCWLPAMLLALAALTLVAAGQGEPLLERMPRGTIEVGGKTYPVRVAATPGHRAAGFQYVPPAEMAGEAIYFSYRQPRQRNFHMRNVAQPLRLAWIAPDGEVLEVIRMTPGTSNHRSPQGVQSVLEFPESHPLAESVRPGVAIHWRRPTEPSD